MNKSILFAAAALVAAPPVYCHAASETRITIDTTHPGRAVSPSLYGVFFEEINHAGDGGLYAELVRNRTYKELDNGKPVAWSLIAPSEVGATMALDDTDPLNTANPSSLRVSINALRQSGRVAVVNEGYWGMALRKGQVYNLSFYARAIAGSPLGVNAQDVDVSLEDADGHSYASGRVTGIGREWKRYSLTLKSNTDVDQARLVIAPRFVGGLWLNVVSLFPKDTFKHRSNGLRPDLAGKVADLHPAFIRFPGGCYVEGDRTVRNSFHWKETLGDIAGRPGHLNDIWGYYSTDGLGYHEYLQMCEDMHASPLFVVNCGMAHHETIPMDQMQPYVQGALDAIEYANGPVTSKWGALRAKNGHPKPFNVRYVEIGNEDAWIAGYPERYKLVYDAIKSHYPNIITIANGMVDDPMETVDDHYYNSPDWFWRNSGLYDNTDRKGPKHYVGEYAVTSACGSGNLRAALAEAAFMTGLERNSDVVTMASYAPLFTNVHNRAWNPDAIPFDSARSYGTPSYWVQELFAANRPKTLLPVTVENTPVEPANVGAGSIGLGTWRTSSDYKDIEVVKDGKTIYRSDFAKAADGWKPQHGQWSVVDGAYRQSELGEREVALLDLPELAGASDYTVHLKARKLSGDEGFLILFRAKDDKNLYWYNVGGWRNTKDAIQRTTDGGIEQVGSYVPDQVETNRWYDVRIDVHGARIQGYLDGKLAMDATEQSSPRFALTAGQLPDGTVIVKAVNGMESAVSSDVDLAEASVQHYSGTATTLTSASPDDENSLDHPDKVAPVSRKIDVSAPSFTYTFPANSVTVLRLKAN